FAALRAAYNRRAGDPAFQRLTCCLLGVASPSDLIRDARTTPFNIGRRIELTDFTEAEAAPLACGLLNHGDTETQRRCKGEGPVDDNIAIPQHRNSAQTPLKRILYWTGGHPYLTQRLCQVVSEKQTTHHSPLTTHHIDQLCAGLFFAPGARERDDNLLF